MVRWHRRRFLQATAGLAAYAAAPRLVRAATSDDGFIVLTAKRASASLRGDEGDPTDIWGYDGTSPGPTLRVRQGETLKVQLVNELAQPTTIHWHGIRLANAMDGTELTQEPVGPGESFDYVFTPPDAGTFWYHAGIGAAEQVARGLYGALIVEEETPREAMSDVVMVLDDWWLLESGALNEKTFGSLVLAAHGGRGDIALRRGSDKAVVALEIQGERREVATIERQGKAEPAASRTRADRPSAQGETAIPKPRPKPKPKPRGPDTGPFTALPGNRLPEIDLDGALAVALVMTGGAMGGMDRTGSDRESPTVRDLVKNGKAWALNDVAGMAEAPLVSLERGRTVTITMQNDTAWAHAMHLHGHHVRIIERDDRVVDDPTWRDVVLLEPREVARVAFVADNPGKWMLHCHILEHKETGMATWIEVR